MQDVTNNVHYENYRSKKLAVMTYNRADNSKNKRWLIKSPLVQMGEERREYVTKMKKMKIKQVFEMTVKEKVQNLKDSETEGQKCQEQVKRNLEVQRIRGKTSSV